MHQLPPPLQTGHPSLDDQHTRMLTVLSTFRATLESGNSDLLSELIQQGISICLAHWRCEEDLLERTGWSRSILDCHLKEHERFEGLMISTFVSIASGRRVDPLAVDAFYHEVLDHIAVFDLPLAEAVARRVSEHTSSRLAIRAVNQSAEQPPT